MTFKTGKDALGWDQSQARTYDAECRHTALAALARLRAAAIRGTLAGLLTLPDPGDSRHATAPASDSDDISDADLRISPGGAPLPVTGGQPCPARIPPVTLPAAEALKITRLAERYAAGLLTRARLACHLRWSHWRRRHQARARWHHYSARLEPIAA